MAATDVTESRLIRLGAHIRNNPSTRRNDASYRQATGSWESPTDGG